MNRRSATRWLTALLAMLAPLAPAAAAGLLHDYGPYTSLAVEPGGRIWVGARHQLILLDGSSGEQLGRWERPVEALALDAGGRLWGLSRGRLFRVDSSDQGPVEVDDEPGVGAGAHLVGGATRDVFLLDAQSGIHRLDEAGRISAAFAGIAETRGPTGETAAVVDRTGSLYWLGDCREELDTGAWSSRPVNCTVYRLSYGGAVEAQRDGVDQLLLRADGRLALLTREGDLVPAAGETALAPPPGSVGAELIASYDGSDRPWILDAGAGIAWEREGEGWVQHEALPVEVGRLIALAPEPVGEGLIALGVGGVARLGHHAPPLVLLEAPPQMRLPPAAYLIGVVLAIGAFGLVTFAVLLFQSQREVRRRWSALDGLMGVASFLAGQISTQLLLLGSFEWQISDPRALLISFGAGSALAALWLRMRLKARGVRWGEIGLSTNTLGRDLLFGGLAAAPAWAAAVLVALIGEKLGFPAFLYSQESASRLFDVQGPAQIATVGLIGVVLAPIAEEVVFRGYLLRNLSERWGVVAGLVASGLLFGAVHGEGILTVGVLGIAFGALALWRRGLVAPIVAHALVNGVSLAALIFG